MNFLHYVASVVIIFLHGTTLAKEFKIETKSFIDETDTSSLAIGKTVMACVVNAGTLGSEKPLSGDSKSGMFRLRSSVTYNAICSSGKIAVTKVNEQLEPGKEFWVIPAKVAWDIKPINSAPPMKTSKIIYSIKGEPNTLGNCLMNAAEKRGCTWIWHKLTTEFTCDGDEPELKIKLEGSAFPSHRTWVNGNCVAQQDQGSFDKLWQCQSNANEDPTKVIGGGLVQQCH